MRNIFDSHAHYDDRRYKNDLERLVALFPKKGVCGVINVGCDMETSMQSADFAETFPRFFATVGVHPGCVDNLPKDYIQILTRLLDNERVVAIGEIGLDYHYKPFDKELQIRIFREQMELASLKGRKVVIHSRDACADTMTVVRDFPDVTGVVHCFSGSDQTAREYVALGYYVGFTGVVTFSNAPKVAMAAKAVPLDRLLVETDCPYMAPEPFRGQRCDSTMLSYTIHRLAELHNVSPQEIADRTMQNACTLFGIDQEELILPDAFG